MNEWFRIIAGLVVLGMSAILGRVFYLLDKKANKSSTDARFDDVLQRIDRQQLTIEKHMDACDLRQQKQQDTLDEIRAHAAQTEKSIAVLSTRFEK